MRNKQENCPLACGPALLENAIWQKQLGPCLSRVEGENGFPPNTHNIVYYFSSSLLFSSLQQLTGYFMSLLFLAGEGEREREREGGSNLCSARMCVFIQLWPIIRRP